MNCKRCVMHPELRQSGWADPEYICPVCKQSYWVRDGKFYHEKPEDDKKTKMEKATKKFLGAWQLQGVLEKLKGKK